MAEQALTFPPPSYSTRWFSEYFGSQIWISATLRSFGVAFVTAILATVLGGMAALALARSDSRFGKAVFGLMLAPMIVPRIVIAVGDMHRPRMLNIPGEDLPHVAHYFDEPHRYYRKKLLIVGGRNSAVEAALELFRAGVHVTLVHRHAKLGSSIKYWVRPDMENRIGAPASIGEHTRELLKELGLQEDRIAALEERKIILAEGPWSTPGKG